MKAQKTVGFLSQHHINEVKALRKLEAFNLGIKHNKSSTKLLTVKSRKECLFKIDQDIRDLFNNSDYSNRIVLNYPQKRQTKRRIVNNVLHNSTLAIKKTFEQALTKESYIKMLASLYPNEFSSSVRAPKAAIWGKSMAERKALGLKVWANPYTR